VANGAPPPVELKRNQRVIDRNVLGSSRNDPGQPPETDHHVSGVARDATDQCRIPRRANEAPMSVQVCRGPRDRQAGDREWRFRQPSMERPDHWRGEQGALNPWPRHRPQLSRRSQRHRNTLSRGLTIVTGSGSVWGHHHRSLDRSHAGSHHVSCLLSQHRRVCLSRRVGCTRDLAARRSARTAGGERDRIRPLPGTAPEHPIAANRLIQQGGQEIVAEMAIARLTLSRSWALSRWKMNQLSPWLSNSASMLPGC